MENEMKNEMENQTAENSQNNEIIKQTKTELFWEIFRFLLVGGIATVVDYFVFWLLDGVLLPKVPIHGETWSMLALWIATGAGFIVGMIVNWVLSITFVFRAVRNKDEATSAKSFWVFTIISVIGLALTLFGVWLIAKWIPEFELFGRIDFFGTTWSKWVAKMIMTCIVLIWNYIGRKIFVFKS
ncbi:MAG: GtrA family protein [Clostridiales bacterium]|nr:GtrA family protein [Clostridiales bacterium]